MVTLTYPRATDDWRYAKRHLRAFGERLRRRYGDRFSFCWFLEFTAAGVPHFHGFLDVWLPRDELARWWAEIVSSSDPAHARAGTRIEALRSGRAGAASYARKYAAKLEQKELPSMLKNSGFGRWWGIQGGRCVVAAATRVTRRLLDDIRVQIAHENLRKALFQMKAAGKARFWRLEHCDAWWIRSRIDEDFVRELIEAVNVEVRRCQSFAGTDRTAANDEQRT